MLYAFPCQQNIKIGLGLWIILHISCMVLNEVVFVDWLSFTLAFRRTRTDGTAWYLPKEQQEIFKFLLLNINILFICDLKHICLCIALLKENSVFENKILNAVWHLVLCSYYNKMYFISHSSLDLLLSIVFSIKRWMACSLAALKWLYIIIHSICTVMFFETHSGSPMKSTEMLLIRGIQIV